MKKTTNISEVAFVAALWAFKRRQRTEEPTAREFNLCALLAESLARQVQIEFEHQTIQPLIKTIKQSAP